MKSYKFLCVECGKVLTEKDSIFNCDSCNKTWKYNSGIPSFYDDLYCYDRDHLNEEQYNTFFLDLENMTWEDAIEKLVARKDINKAWKIKNFLTNKKRNDFLKFLPLDENTVALDYGSGWGNTSYTLSDTCKEVYAMDADFFRLRFSKAHFDAKNIQNINTVCAGAENKLPFENNKFDVVVMNGVLEWTPAFIDGHPFQVHSNILKEIKRVLKPGGSIAIAIENRFGYKYFVGKKDYHSGGLRWVTFLPRFLATVHSLIWLKKPYRTWFYSYDALKNMLNDSGFDAVQRYSYYPNHVNYHCMYCIEDNARLKDTANMIVEKYKPRFVEKNFFKIFSALGILKYFVQDFFVVAKNKK